MEKNNVTEQVIVNVLLSVVKTHQGMGKGTLALILKGSRDRIILQRNLDQSEFYGALFWYTIEIIEDFFVQLKEQGCIEVRTFGFYSVPVLYLSQKGQAVLEQKSLVSLLERKKKVQLKMNESVEQTFQLFQERKSVVEVAKERGLEQSTIWHHLTTLLSLRYLSLDEVLPKRIQEQVFEALQKTHDLRLKSIQEQCPEVSYEEIRCVLACLEIKESKKAI